ncbi:methyltransferase TRM13-domain-containing protein [Catenaria anguillulae PL171]|uniref:tRNA:m(4)X modification enzyme TRM13 n=1 Tax=Catenaria anguillulae PL171 TaxID=765915 RepID=A0A1Y2HQD1_9FUNG|nr:methyltransferase TRM13-domain-containing protein [Catenaria anguillulae PL171]
MDLAASSGNSQMQPPSPIARPPVRPREVDDLTAADAQSPADSSLAASQDEQPPSAKKQRTDKDATGSDGRKGKKTGKAVQPPPPSKPNQCHFFVTRKQRYCSLAARKGTNYCGEHGHLDTSSAAAARDPRVPCPLDPNHTVQQSDLKKHLLRCNSRLPDLPYRSTDVNLVRSALSEPARLLQERSKDEIASLVASIEAAHAEMLAQDGDIPTLVLDHPVVHTRRDAKQNRKHVNQVASLIGHLQHMGSLKEEHVFVEFGAGKGEFGHFVHKALSSQRPDGSHSSAPFFMVDRSNFRKKFDAYMQVERIALDIKDLKLSLVPSLRHYHGLDQNLASDSSSTSASTSTMPHAKPAGVRPLVGFSKHLCGGATDLTLACLDGYMADLASQTKSSATTSSAVHSILIALCCHHRCSAETYVGLDWLSKFGIQAHDIHALGQMGGWAVCGVRPKMTVDGDQDDDEDLEEHSLPEGDLEEQGTPAAEHYSGMSHADRERIGFMVKRVLDYGRVQWLRSRDEWNAAGKMRGWKDQLDGHVES